MLFFFEEGREDLTSGEEREAAADSLIKSSGGAKIGIYTEKQLTRKLRDEDKKLPVVSEAQVPPSLAAYLYEKSAAGLLRNSGLNELDLIACRLMLLEYDFCDIAKRLGIHRNRVFRLRNRLKKILKAQRNLDRYYGLWEVYWQEVNRHIYRKPRLVWD